LPNAQHFRIGLLKEQATRMTCREANCAQERSGWVTVLDVGQQKHREAARLIKQDSGRRFIEVASEGAREYLAQHAAGLGITVTPELAGLLDRTPPGMAVFIFPPGQQCFRAHLDREVLFVHDTPARTRVHTRPLDWNEDMNIEADKINRIRQRG
jgi:hypothetical protein